MIMMMRGCRGTMPVSGSQFNRFGGKTTCLTIHNGASCLIIDAGTGIAGIMHEMAEKSELPAITLLFTHFHLDHVAGLPSFEMLYNRDADITIMADAQRHWPWRDTLMGIMSKPLWPVELGDLPARMRLSDLPASGQGIKTDGIFIRWMRVPHPQQSLAYSFEAEGFKLVLATDAEFRAGHQQTEFIRFCEGADCLIMDAHYRPDEYPAFRGWGHSSFEAAAEAANMAGVGRLVLTHHAPTRTDDEVLQIEQETRQLFPNTTAGYEGMLLNGNPESE